MSNSSQRSPKSSEIVMREMVMPQHTNPQGTIFGGQIMSWVDIAAAMCAARHCQRPVVTVHVDEISFLSPIYVGEHVCIRARVNYVGNTSLLVGVRVERENPYTGVREKTTSAYLTFVSLDDHRRPLKVPELILETDEDRRRAENAKARAEANRELRAKIKEQNEATHKK